MTTDIAGKPVLSSSPKGTSVRIGLLGMYASANLGDTAIQTVVMAALRSRRPDIVFVGLSHDPEDVVRTYGIPSFPASGGGALVNPQVERPINTRSEMVSHTAAKHLPFSRRFLALRNINRQMRDLDMLLISGGGQIDDFWGGPWQQPFRLFVWCVCASLQRKSIASFAVGVDGLRSQISAWFVRRALKMAQYRTFRDTGSLKVLRDMGFNSTASVCPDPAFAFRVPSVRVEMKRLIRPKFAVISPISSHAFSGASDAEYDAYLTALATVAEVLLQQGCEVRFVCSQIKMDPPVVSRVIARIQGNAAMFSFIDVKTVDDYLSAVRDAELVIASRLHALILSVVAGTPIIAISPARKVRQQMIDVGVEDFCLDLKSLHVSVLLSRVQTVLARRDELKKIIASRVCEFHKQLEAAIDQLAEVVPSTDHA